MANEIVIKRGLKLGELHAEADRDLLNSCWIDNGYLEKLLDMTSNSSIILGRTGSGKSALLQKISVDAEHTVMLDPDDVSIRFLEHSNIIQFFTEIGVKLDLFYRMLWRHILIVELLKLRYNIRSERDSQNFISTFRQWAVRDKVKKNALEYFTEWGDRFWLETDEQLKELTTKFTSDINARLGSRINHVGMSLESAKGLSEEHKVEICSLANQYVSEIQIRRLAEIFDMLAHNAFNDKQKKYYILIDQLDEDWADTETRYRFIRALVEETKSLKRIPQVKIITALRRDLLDLVFDKTRDAGFQQEKYEAYMVNLSWEKGDLKKMLEKRIQEVYKRQYTSDSVRLEDVFPSAKKKHTREDPIGYILDRTLLRPRDALQFANECFAAASERPRISWEVISTAESNYSTKRLNSLLEEWAEYFPSLDVTLDVLRGIQIPFKRSVLIQRIDDLSVELHDANDDDPVVKDIRAYYDPTSSTSDSAHINTIMMCLYYVGVIGIKISASAPFAWSHINQPRVSQSECKRANGIDVHKMYRRALDISDRNSET